jgi:phosphate transport system substrate-binding protein
MMEVSRMRRLTLSLFLMVLLAACRANEPPPAPAALPEVSAESYLRVDGSTSTLPLQVAIACQLLEVKCTWQEGDLFTTTWHIAPELRSGVPQAAVETIYQLRHSGTHSAYVNLIHGEADVILVARQPSSDELDEARRNEVQLEAVPVARDAFVFIVHQDNPVRSLTLDQVRSVYSGALNDWSQVGGPEGPISPYQRNRNSGSQELMEQLLMRGAAMIDAPDMILEGMMGPIHAILSDPAGIGYSVYYYATCIFPQPDLRLLAIDGQEPAFDSLADGSYPLTTEVYAVVRRSLPSDDPARQLAAWLVTPDGQAAVLESGYVPLTPGEG